MVVFLASFHWWKELMSGVAVAAVVAARFYELVCDLVVLERGPPHFFVKNLRFPPPSSLGRLLARCHRAGGLGGVSALDLLRGRVCVWPRTLALSGVD